MLTIDGGAYRSVGFANPDGESASDSQIVGIVGGSWARRLGTETIQQ